MEVGYNPDVVDSAKILQDHNYREFYDSVPGSLLDAKGVLVARQEELKFMQDFLVYEKAQRDDCRNGGHAHRHTTAGH